LSREATGPSIARTVSAPGREAAEAAEAAEIAGIAVKRQEDRANEPAFRTMSLEHKHAQENAEEPCPIMSNQQFSPLCDLHHVSMRRSVLEDDSQGVRSYYACVRRDCTRVFRESDGYSDRIAGEFNDSRAFAQKCPRCGTALYLAEVDHSKKVETWECLQIECDFREEYPSPSAR
jgi:hypothetical protein